MTVEIGHSFVCAAAVAWNSLPASENKIM